MPLTAHRQARAVRTVLTTSCCPWTLAQVGNDRKAQAYLATLDNDPTVRAACCSLAVTTHMYGLHHHRVNEVVEQL